LTEQLVYPDYSKYPKDSEYPKYSENSHSQQQHKYSDQILCERIFCVRRYSNISDNSDIV